MSVFRLAFVFAVLCVPGICSATKPCGTNPCRTAAGQFNEVGCRDAADWIAVGSIRDVRRHREGAPVNKDFSAFVFVPEHWEKGSPVQGRIEFKVGWCDNPTEIPDDPSGNFRFYGLKSIGPSGESRFLDFERVK